MSINKPLVSVLMITYNQAEYIQQALTSVLDQICRFEFEVILSNDASSDNSDKLISEVIKNHTNGFRVKYFNQPENLGMNPNLAFVYAKCNGKYIAVCEGDDYWTNRFKLQKQVDFLEANPDFSLCYHPVDVHFLDGSTQVDFGVKQLFDDSEATIFELVVFGNFIHTSSAMFKKFSVRLPDNFTKSPIGDYFIWCLVAEKGKLRKLNEVMSVYRYDVGSFSKSSDKVKKNKVINTYYLIFDSIDNLLLKKLISLKIDSLKVSQLPKKLQSKSDFSDLFSSISISGQVSFLDIFKLLIFKFYRFFTMSIINKKSNLLLNFKNRLMIYLYNFKI